MEKTIDVVAIGELLFVLRAPQWGTLERSRTLECLCGGAEGNVVVGLSRLGLKTAYMSQVRDNFIGRTLVDDLRSHGVDTQGIRWCNEGRMGILFIELGAPPRANLNVYDRENASILSFMPDDCDWHLFHRARNFYFSGITAALGNNCRLVLERAVGEARKQGMKVFFDLNYRSKLWTYDQAGAFLESVAPSVNVLFVRQEDMEPLFSLAGSPGDMASRLRERFGSEAVVLTRGAEGAVVALSDRVISRKAIPSLSLNRIGVGDSFVAGFLYGFIRQGAEAALAYGTAMSALKTTIPSENRPIIGLRQVERIIASVEGDADRRGVGDVER